VLSTFLNTSRAAPETNELKFPSTSLWQWRTNKHSWCISGAPRLIHIQNSKLDQDTITNNSIFGSAWNIGVLNIAEDTFLSQKIFAFIHNFMI